MSSISRVQTYNDGVYEIHRQARRAETARLEDRFAELQIEERQIKDMLRLNEQKRIEMARHNNRAPGSQVDIMV
jgi:hypothetical protein